MKETKYKTMWSEMWSPGNAQFGKNGFPHSEVWHGKLKILKCLTEKKTFMGYSFKMMSEPKLFILLMYYKNWYIAFIYLKDSQTDIPQNNSKTTLRFSHYHKNIQI